MRTQYYIFNLKYSILYLNRFLFWLAIIIPIAGAIIALKHTSGGNSIGVLSFLDPVYSAIDSFFEMLQIYSRFHLAGLMCAVLGLALSIWNKDRLYTWFNGILAALLSIDLAGLYTGNWLPVLLSQLD